VSKEVSSGSHECSNMKQTDGLSQGCSLGSQFCLDHVLKEPLLRAEDMLSVYSEAN
jgi:hypothetical protein